MFDVLMQVPSGADYDYMENCKMFKTIGVQAETERGAMIAVVQAKFPGKIIKVEVSAVSAV